MMHPSENGDRKSLTREQALKEVKRLETELARERRRAGSSLPHSHLTEVSHELRTPITGIVALAEILSKTAVSDQDKKFAGLIEKSGRQLSTTVNAVLSLAKLDAGESDLERRTLNVADEVERVFSTFKPQAEFKGIEYTLSVDDTDAPLYASLHSGALSSVVRNLLSNAIKYTETGSVRIYVRTVSQSGSPMVEIEVADTGVGITESFLPEVFDRFSQEATYGDDAAEGIGLGLTLVKRFTEEMEGTVDVETEKGEGSQFFVRFPRVASNSRRSTPPSSTPDRPGESIVEILLIDGNPHTQRAVRTLLKDDWGVTPARSLAEGFELVTKRRNVSCSPFDLILIGLGDDQPACDPGRTGRVTEGLIDCDIPVVVLTCGNSTVPVRLGVDGYIRQPLTSSKLVTEVNRYLSA